jgi:hypothetical protein
MRKWSFLRRRLSHRATKTRPIMNNSGTGSMISIIQSHLTGTGVSLRTPLPADPTSPTLRRTWPSRPRIRGTETAKAISRPTPPWDIFRRVDDTLPKSSSIPGTRGGLVASNRSSPAPSRSYRRQQRRSSASKEILEAFLTPPSSCESRGRGASIAHRPEMRESRRLRILQ